MKLGPLPIGVFEIAIILIVVLIIFGPKNLPKLGTAIGKAMKNLREGLGGKKKVKEAEESEETVPVKETQETEAQEIEVEVIDKPAPGAKAAAARDKEGEGVQ